jgi:hypothetical protein
MPLLVAMHAPDGVCTVEMSAQPGERFSDFRIVGGDPDRWTRVECCETRIVAENHDASQHLWIACNVEKGPFGACGGIIEEYIAGNACSMWVSIDGGEQKVVSTNPGFDRRRTVDQWFCFMSSVLPKLDKKFIR